MRATTLLLGLFTAAAGCAHSPATQSASSSAASPAVADAFHAVRSGTKATAIAGHYRFCATPRGLDAVTTTGSSQLNSKIRDSAIESTVKDAIEHDPALQGSNIDVATHQGEVKLTGQVPSDEAAIIATKLALNPEGVVFANIALTSPESPQPPVRMQNQYPSCQL